MGKSSCEFLGAVILITILSGSAVVSDRIVWDARQRDEIRGIYEQQQQARFIEIITQPICGA
jgi:hypothetical protein